MKYIQRITTMISVLVFTSINGTGSRWGSQIQSEIEGNYWKKRAVCAYVAREYHSVFKPRFTNGKVYLGHQLIFDLYDENVDAQKLHQIASILTTIKPTR